MADPCILFVKPQVINDKDRRALQKAGVVVVEIENPADMKFTRAYAELSASELLRAAAEAIPASEFSQKAFAKALCAAIVATKLPPKEPGNGG